MANNDLTDEERALFQNAMRTVTPLKQIKKQPSTRSIKPIPIRQTLQPERQTTQYYLSSYYTEEVSPESILSYHIPGFPKSRLSELRKGDIRWQGRIDLHGFTVPQAQDRLCQFITQQSQLGHRCVLIIHGKGSPTGNAPVLKNCINHWLKQLPHILAFHSALPKDGGSGALYVFLKK